MAPVQAHGGTGETGIYLWRYREAVSYTGGQPGLQLKYNDNQFGVAFVVRNTSGTARTASVDYVQDEHNIYTIPGH